MQSESDEIPLHYESVSLGSRTVAAIWIFGVAAVGGGIAGMVRYQATVGEIPAAITAACGALLLFVAIRCRRSEVVLGRQWLTAQTGPLRQRVPVELVADYMVQAARGWRSWYSTREVVIRISTGETAITVASNHTGELTRALDEVRKTDEHVARQTDPTENI